MIALYCILQVDLLNISWKASSSCQMQLRNAPSISSIWLSVAQHNSDALVLSGHLTCLLSMHKCILTHLHVFCGPLSSPISWPTSIQPLNSPLSPLFSYTFLSLQKPLNFKHLYALPHPTYLAALHNPNSICAIHFL
jgi:hypothetical protein